jgi:hypothetical protein
MSALVGDTDPYPQVSGPKKGKLGPMEEPWEPRSGSMSQVPVTQELLTSLPQLAGQQFSTSVDHFVSTFIAHFFMLQINLYQ